MLDSVGKGRAINDISIADCDKFLTILAKLVGIRNENLPDKEESLLLIRSLNRVYGNVKDEEITTAFEMAASGQLDAEEHYQSFSFKYISSVINAYIKQVNEAKKYIPKQKQIEEPLFETEVDWSDTIQFLIKEISNGNEPIIPSLIYDWMIEKNIIQVTNEEKKSAMKMGERIYKSQLMKRWEARPNSIDRSEIEQLDRGYDKTKPVYQKVVNEAKRYILKNYFIEKAKEIKKHT